jgi:hypothetical protein
MLISKVEDYLFLKSFIFWDITLWSPLKVNQSFGGTLSLHLQGQRISPVRNQSENFHVKCSSKTWVDFQQTTQHYIPEGRTLHNHRCENLKAYIDLFLIYLK